MEILFWCCGIIWLIGWVNELATADANMKKHKIEYPHDGVKYAMPIVLLFTWPYFYFYGKAL
jgi:hypothetical protein